MKRIFELLLEPLRRSIIVQLMKIDGLGTFYNSLTTKGVAKEEDFSVNEHIKELHIRFLPDQTTETNISSREFLKKAEFINVKVLLPKEKKEEPEP